jgi:hypothetical protein
MRQAPGKQGGMPGDRCTQGQDAGLGPWSPEEFRAVPGLGQALVPPSCRASRACAEGRGVVVVRNNLHSPGGCKPLTGGVDRPVRPTNKD